jgi:hypothetical protein
LGKVVIEAPGLVLGFAPCGIEHLIEVCGWKIPESFNGLFVLSIHFLFWSLFALFLLLLPDLRKSTFRFAATVIVIVIVATLGGCAHLHATGRGFWP